jgi:hypothetical protein
MAEAVVKRTAAMIAAAMFAVFQIMEFSPRPTRTVPSQFGQTYEPQAHRPRIKFTERANFRSLPGFAEGVLGDSTHKSSQIFDNLAVGF